MALVYAERIRENVRGGDEISEKTQSHVIKGRRTATIVRVLQYSSAGSTPINSARVRTRTRQDELSIDT
jgi:hypothetical protein